MCKYSKPTTFSHPKLRLTKANQNYFNEIKKKKKIEYSESIIVNLVLNRVQFEAFRPNSRHVNCRHLRVEIKLVALFSLSDVKTTNKKKEENFS